MAGAGTKIRGKIGAGAENKLFWLRNTAQNHRLNAKKAATKSLRVQMSLLSIVQMFQSVGTGTASNFFHMNIERYWYGTRPYLPVYIEMFYKDACLPWLRSRSKLRHISGSGSKYNVFGSAYKLIDYR